MSEIIDKFKDNSVEIEIPDFDGVGIFNIKVKRPQLMAMMTQGKIPNRLLGVAAQATIGNRNKKEKQDPVQEAKELAEWIEFYCTICMVEPKYEEVKDKITDDQALAIYAWAIAPIDVLRSFRDKEKNDTNNRNGKVLSEETK